MLSNTAVGSRSLTERGASFMPTLRASDLYVTPDQFDAFRDELGMIHRNARVIANEIWPHMLIDRYCPVQRSQRIRRLRVRGARDVRTYVDRFRSALDAGERMIWVSILVDGSLCSLTQQCSEPCVPERVLRE